MLPTSMLYSEKPEMQFSLQLHTACESDVEMSTAITILLLNWRWQGFACNYTFRKFQNSLKPNNKPMLFRNCMIKWYSSLNNSQKILLSLKTVIMLWIVVSIWYRGFLQASCNFHRSTRWKVEAVSELESKLIKVLLTNLFNHAFWSPNRHSLQDSILRLPWHGFSIRLIIAGITPWSTFDNVSRRNEEIYWKARQIENHIVNCPCFFHSSSGMAHWTLSKFKKSDKLQLIDLNEQSSHHLLLYNCW